MKVTGVEFSTQYLRAWVDLLSKAPLTKIDWNGFVFIGMHKRLVLRMADMVYFLHVGNGYASHHVLSEKMFLIFEPVSDLD